MTKTFEGLDAFTYALDLMVHVYELTENFPKREWYELASQMRRASVSVVSNIAEGQGRLTDGEWRQHLSHARGSLFELEAQVIAARRLGFIDDAMRALVRESARRVGKPLAGLIGFVKRREGRLRKTGHRQPAT
ncbi:MAG: four helix bundle protein [Acidobacteriota bacterium]|nr:four helix bundle protein [Acidobacteriota bacterium]